jgi:predicted ATPase
MKPKHLLKSVRVQNFKALQDSGAVKLTPLTVFIGNNGSGKSSLIEGLETYRNIVVEDLDHAFARWLGFQHVWNKQTRHNRVGEHFENPMEFAWTAKLPEGTGKAELTVNTVPGFNGLYIQRDKQRTPRGDGMEYGDRIPETNLPSDMKKFVAGWQFLSMTPDRMGAPAAKQMAIVGRHMLNRDGSNVAQYLDVIKKKDLDAFNGIVEAMRFVLDYATDFQPAETQEVQRAMFVQMSEREFKVPGWMLSTGTVRILALLAVLRNPDPPPLLVIEEIENGLDPRTVHMLLDEIREAVQAGKTQVIATTHSPYLLNLLPLQTITLVERKEGGSPKFWRPGDLKEVQSWAKRFAPGELYTTGRFKKGKRQ